jgi:ATP dependent DNA ligase domain
MNLTHSPESPCFQGNCPAQRAKANRIHRHTKPDQNQSRTVKVGIINTCRITAACGPDGVSVFDALHRRHKASDAILYAFDLLELDAADLRPLPLSERKAKLARLLARKPVAITFNEHTDEDGATVFRHACKLGFEGIVSERLTGSYRSGPSRDWLKVENPDSPAMRRARAGVW